MMDERSYSGFLDLLYGAAVDPSLLGPVLERLADITGGTSAALVRQNQVDGSGDGLTVRLDPSATDLYFGYFKDRNPLSVSLQPLEFQKRWRPRLATDEDWIPRESFLRSEYYNDFLRPRDVDSVMIISLAARGVDASTISIMRPPSRGRFDRQDLEMTARLHQHLIRAFGLGERLAQGRRLSEDLTEALDRSPHGLFLLDDQARLRHANRVGQALLTGDDALCLIGGRLSARIPEVARKLEALVGAALSRDPARRTGGTLAAPGPRRRLPLSVTVAPLSPERRGVYFSGPSALVCVTDLEAGARLPEQRLRDLFGLTPAEARVALSLFEGASPRETAERHGVSFQTVRFQLAQIFQKTDTNRQSELMRLMMRTVGVDID
jgi:DNA-binding CsgD family transcriptional regulator